ncbi:MAG: hypothetical protein JXA18_08060 [Chitinispirillaceae bacterium]|nr:hypothetical protein [Chitinispirillaceae bacterium]
MGLSLMLEMLTGFSAVMLQAGYLYVMRKRSVRTAVVTALLTLPALYLSLESMNSFLTYDESYIVYEPVDLVNNSLLQWNMGALRTTDLLVGIPIAGVKMATGVSMNILAVFAKSLHWFLSLLLILFIIDFLYRLLNKQKNFPLFYLVAFYSIGALPVVLMAQKIITYDAFSMLLGGAAVLLLAAGWREKRPLHLYASVVVAALAAQEKLIASPLVWICFVLVPLRIGCWRGLQPLGRTLRRTINATCIAVASALSVFMASHLLISLINSAGGPGRNAFNVLHPLVSGFWPLLRAAGIDTAALFTNPLFERGYFIPLLAAAVVAVMTGVTTAGAAVIGLTYRLRKNAPAFGRAAWRMEVVNYLFFFAVYAGGIAGTFLIRAFLAPHYPVAPGAYAGYTFNRTFVYFGAKSLLTHTAFSIGWAYTFFVNALPTVFLIMAIANFVSAIRRRSAPGNFLSAVFTGALLMPLLYGLFQVPVGNRYFNLFLLFVAVKIAADFADVLAGIRRPILAAAMMIILIIVEIMPFRPLFGSFRPLWTDYSSAYNQTPSKAILNPWWMGWGEEVYLAGRQIKKQMKRDNPYLSGVTIYTNYQGEWLYRKNSAHVVLLDTVDSIGYSENDFFVLNRMGIAQSSMNFPGSVAPFGTIGFRGFVQGWIFRGSDLKAAGFRFKRKKSYSKNSLFSLKV